MRFVVARSQKQRNRLDQFFESYCVWRDAVTREWIILWRPLRLGGLILGLGAYFYIGSVAAVTWWMQAIAPGVAVGYRDVADPRRWGDLPEKWTHYQITQAALKDTTPAPAANAPVEASPMAPPVAAPASDPAGTTSPSAAAPTFGPLLTQFFTHNGGVEKLREIRTISIHGTVTMAGGGPEEFAMAKLLPGGVRLSVHNPAGGMDVTVVSDGRQTWKWLGDPIKNGVHTASSAEASALQRESLLCDLAATLYQNPRSVREVPVPPGQSEPYHFVQSVLPDQSRATVALNAASWRPERVQVDYDQAGVPSSYTILVRDWMMVEGVAEPASVEVYDNGKKLLECHFAKIEYNPGLFDERFAPPADAPHLPDPTAVATSFGGGAEPATPSAPEAKVKSAISTGPQPAAMSGAPPATLPPAPSAVLVPATTGVDPLAGI